MSTRACNSSGVNPSRTEEIQCTMARLLLPTTETSFAVHGEPGMWHFAQLGRKHSLKLHWRVLNFFWHQPSLSFSVTTFPNSSGMTYLSTGHPRIYKAGCSMEFPSFPPYQLHPHWQPIDPATNLRLVSFPNCPRRVSSSSPTD